jgi:invasion protein IalB
MSNCSAGTVGAWLSTTASTTALMLAMLSVTACGGGGGEASAPVSAIVPVISIGGVTVDEGASGVANARLTVTLSSTTTATASVAYATSNGSAVAGEDYSATSGTVTFTPGTSSREITVAVTGDVLFEPDESFEVVLSSPQNATLGTARGAVTIRNDDVQTASIRLAPDVVVAFVTERIPLSAAALAADGSVLPGKPVTWSVANPAVASISATGELTATAVGTTAVTATIEGRSSQLQLTVTGEATAWPQLKAHFPYVAASGAFRVASDIGTAFSQQHLEHLLKTWQFFSGKFARSPGTYTEMYYTRDLDGLYRKVLQFCPTSNIPGARNLTACFNAADSTYVWFVVPDVEPDFGTQLHEIAHTFLYSTQLDSANWPWFNEGISMYWESGSFDAGGTWTVTQPTDYLTSNFGRWHAGGSLIPLQTLLTMSRDQFYGESDATRPYSQAGMLLYFLFDRYPQFMAELLGAINDQTVKTNADVISRVTQGTNLSIAELEQAYTQFALDPGAARIVPAITANPVSQTITAGQTATFSVTATGSTPLSYQWQKNGTNVSGATSASYTTPATTLSDSGATFRVTVTNSAGSATSSSATLTVTSSTTPTAPAIAANPVSQTITAGQTATFSVTATGSTPLSYQWQKNGTNVSGATSASYTTPATTLSDSGATFRVTVTNSAGSATSSSATLTVTSSTTPTAPSISSNPASRTVSEGQTASFSVTASGTGPLSYQWQKNGVDISGATGASYTTPPAVFADNGSNFRVSVRNAYGSATSSAATLTVTSGTSTTGQLLLLDRTFDHTTSYKASLLGETPWSGNENCIFVQALEGGKGTRVCNHEAFKFFQMPSNNPTSWRSPVDYSRGTLYQRVQILSKPSSTPARYGMCMFQDNVWAERHACGDLKKISFTAPGTYYSTQDMGTLYQYSTAIDWTRKPHVIMLHITDANNRQPDSYDGFMDKWFGTPNWGLYYPMRLRYTAIIVPPGGGAPVWPN